MHVPLDVDVTSASEDGTSVGILTTITGGSMVTSSEVEETPRSGESAAVPPWSDTVALSLLLMTRVLLQQYVQQI